MMQALISEQFNSSAAPLALMQPHMACRVAAAARLQLHANAYALWTVAAKDAVIRHCILDRQFVATGTSSLPFRAGVWGLPRQPRWPDQGFRSHA